MHFQINEAIEVLERTPATLNALLRGRSHRWLHCRPTPDTFSPIDILGHLIFGEMTDWIPRARIILECQETRAFDPFDRFGFSPLIEGKTESALLDQFAELRKRNLDTLQSFNLDERQLNLRGKHPELGPVTMRNLLATWAVHDLGHLSQIMRVMSNEYNNEVGPWRAYLSILK